MDNTTNQCQSIDPASTVAPSQPTPHAAQDAKHSGINNTPNQTDPTTKATTRNDLNKSETTLSLAGYAEKARNPTTHSQQIT